MNSTPDTLKIFNREEKDRIKPDEVVRALQSNVWQTCMNILEIIDKERQKKGQNAMSIGDEWAAPFLETSDILYSLFHRRVVEVTYENLLDKEENPVVSKSTHIMDQEGAHQNLLFRFTKNGQKRMAS